MKKIWLIGGFGNVLFQIFAYNIVRNKGFRDVFYVTTLTEKNFITKTIKWKVHQKLYHNLINDSEKLKISNFYALFAILIGFLSKATRMSFAFSTFYINNKTLDRNNLASNIFGYFQDKEFLSAHKAELHSFGQIIKEKYALDKAYDIVVHYRKGDSAWAILHAEYYESIKNLLKKETRKIHIVTDSHKDAEEFFSDVNNITIMNSPNAIEDFKVMVSSTKLYCAPSTFSWWAAHALDKDSEVVAPKFFENDLGVYVKAKYQLI